ncbi:MAG: TonB family protein [Myxococcota bacterium]|jgi:TonB family protein
MNGEHAKPQHTAASRGGFALLVALALQVPLFLFLQDQTGGEGLGKYCQPALLAQVLGGTVAPPSGYAVSDIERICGDRQPRVVKARVIPRQKKQDEPELAIPEDAQVVEVPDQDDVPKVEPKEVRFLSNKTTRTKKETRSERVERSTTKAQGNVTIETPSPVQSEKSTSADPTKTASAQEELKLADATTRLPDAERGRVKPESVLERGKDAQILLPSTSTQGALANLQALSGDFTTNDYLPDVDPSKSTLLNANKYKFADFFLGVKRAVEKHWRPAQIYRRRDPTGRAFGVKDRYTLLRVTLDDDGRVLRLLTTRDSGLDFMDSEAKQAFQKAQPFPNPPVGLLNAKNEVVFEFGFYFEITGGTRRYRWKRL